MNNLKEFLDEKVIQYNQANFIENDPIQIPHAFTKKQDIEIAGLFAAVLAWGQRATIIKKCKELINLMDNAPYDFIKNHTLGDLKPFLTFKHRTFNATDTLYFIHFLQQFYQKNDSLEFAFLPKNMPADEVFPSVESALKHFHQLFFSLEDSPHRTKKHISTPARKSACKRLNMYLRWMVRHDDKGVDFGLWTRLSPANLICPLDLHVERVGRMLHLFSRKQVDWLTALELTENLRKFDALDPVKYDFALFGLGIEKFVK